MMSYLTYITAFFMNFELLPILTDYANYKKGGMFLFLVMAAILDTGWR
jgi:Mg2+ and Co2+ transporter CorA